MLLLWLFLFLFLLLMIGMGCYYYCRQECQNKLRAAAWETLRRNHPALERLFRRYAAEPDFFASLDRLMQVETSISFQEQVAALTKKYPDFAEHINSLTFTSEETWRRFQNHRALAKVVFSALR